MAALVERVATFPAVHAPEAFDERIGELCALVMLPLHQLVQTLQFSYRIGTSKLGS